MLLRNLQDSRVVDYPKPKQAGQVLRGLMRGEPLEASVMPSGAAAAPSPQSVAAALAGIFAGSGGVSGDSGAIAAAAMVASGGASATACGLQEAATSGQAGPQMVCNITVR
jgi:hypothetical protein